MFYFPPISPWFDICFQPVNNYSTYLLIYPLAVNVEKQNKMILILLWVYQSLILYRAYLGFRLNRGKKAIVSYIFGAAGIVAKNCVKPKIELPYQVKLV